MSIEILQKTNDGEDLAPHHLSLLQSAVNGFLTEAGDVAFCELYQLVKTGYKKPFFHGIENMTIDHIGYVYWKGKQVEHYNLPWGYSEEAKKHAEELASRCSHLESLNVPVSCTAAIWRWEQYQNQKPEVFAGYQGA